MLEKKYKQKYECLEITDFERDAVKAYKGIDYSSINSMLEMGLDNESNVQKTLSFSGYNVGYIKNIVEAYSAMFKYAIQNNSTVLPTLYRGTRVGEIKNIEQTKQINKFLSTTTDQNMAEGYFSLNWSDPASIFVRMDGVIPYVSMAGIDEDYGNNWEKELLIAPFTNVKSISECSKYKGLTKYNMTIEKQELSEMPKEDRAELLNQINSEASEINETLQSFFRIDAEMENISYRIQSLQQRAAKGGLTLEERKDNSEWMDKLWKDYEVLLSQKTGCTEKINIWKKKVIDYCKAECREVEKNIEFEMQKEETRIEQERDARELEDAKNSLASKKSHAQSMAENTDNDANDMKIGIAKIKESQLNYSKMAKELGITYNGWCDASKAQEKLTDLTSQLSRVKELTNLADIDITSIDDQYQIKKSNINTIADFNNAVNSILVGIETEELDNIKNIELNLFKKAIANRITEIKVATDSGKIKSEEDKINNKSGLKRFFGKLIGQDKTDDFARKLIQEKKNAMSKKLNGDNNVDLNKTYSIHEMLAEIDLYVSLNGADEEMKNGVETLLKLRKGITTIFRVDEDKIKQIVQNARNENLPMAIQNEKLTKQQRMQRETQSWIRQNGYDKTQEVNIRTEISQPRDNLASRLHALSNYIKVNLPDERDRDSEKPETLEKVDLDKTL